MFCSVLIKPHFILDVKAQNESQNIHCSFVSVCVYGLTILMLLGQASKLTKVFQDIHRASEGDLVLAEGNSHCSCIHYLLTESKIDHCESNESNLAGHCLLVKFCLVHLVSVVEIACQCGFSSFLLKNIFESLLVVFHLTLGQLLYLLVLILQVSEKRDK